MPIISLRTKTAGFCFYFFGIKRGNRNLSHIDAKQHPYMVLQQQLKRHPYKKLKAKIDK
jgi:hypothetical protein